MTAHPSPETARPDAGGTPAASLPVPGAEARRSRNLADGWLPVPRAWLDRVKAGDLNVEQLGILVMLAGQANYRPGPFDFHGRSLELDTGEALAVSRTCAEAFHLGDGDAGRDKFRRLLERAQSFGILTTRQMREIHAPRSAPLSAPRSAPFPVAATFPELKGIWQGKTESAPLPAPLSAPRSAPILKGETVDRPKPSTKETTGAIAPEVVLGGGRLEAPPRQKNARQKPTTTATPRTQQVAAILERLFSEAKGTPYRLTKADRAQMTRLAAYPEASDAELQRRAGIALADAFSGHGMTPAKLASQWATWAKPRGNASKSTVLSDVDNAKHAAVPTGVLRGGL